MDGCLTTLRNKPQQKQPRQLSASIHASIVSQCIQLSCDVEKCVLLLCAWKASFLKSGHIYRIDKDIISYHISKLKSNLIFWPDHCKSAGSGSDMCSIASSVKIITKCVAVMY